MSASQSEIERTDQALAEEAWIDVIRRMDEVYTELVTSLVALCNSTSSQRPDHGNVL